MAAAPRILVVGAGIVGQTLACALARRSMACEIVEIKDDFDVGGAGMMLQGTALRALLDIDLVGEMAAAGWSDPAQPLVFLDTRGEIVLQPPERNIVGDGQPASIAIRRQAIHDVLNRAVTRAGVPIKMGTTVETIDDTGDAIHVVFSDGSAGRYDLVVGCDGIRSRVRALTFPGVAPQFAGFCNWRMILPRPASVNRMTWMWGHGKTIGLLPVSDRLIYVVGVGKAASPERPSPDAALVMFRRKFACFGGSVPDVLAMDIAPADMLYTIMEEVKLPPPWYRGRTVVMGDAAHAACPFWAQGGAMGIEDAIVLAQELEQNDRIDIALEHWLTRRYARARFVQEGSFQTGQMLTRDVESDEPKIFPPEVRELMQKESASIAMRLAEPV